MGAGRRINVSLIFKKNLLCTTLQVLTVYLVVDSVDEEAFEAAALIIILRLWRIVRVVNGKTGSMCIECVNAHQCCSHNHVNYSPPSLPPSFPPSLLPSLSLSLSLHLSLPLSHSLSLPLKVLSCPLRLKHTTIFKRLDVTLGKPSMLFTNLRTNFNFLRLANIFRRMYAYIHECVGGGR